MSEPYAVLVVTHQAVPDLPACFAAIAALRPAPAELVVVDCASQDGSAEAARRAWPEGISGEVVPLSDNRGFAGGMNVAIARSRAAWVLLLNADARPDADYVARLLARAGSHPRLRVGGVTGRLLRPGGPPRRLDACGMRLTAAWRHLDRGSGEVDRAQLARPERVFGATGAASLFRRRALADVALGGEVFDRRFHSFREDAELCFRLRERGWEVLYEPDARCEHRRAVLPERRTALPAAVNFHSLKNRYLLRLYHQSLGNLLWTLPFTLARDLAALSWVLARERTSLPAYAWLWRHRAELLARRRAIQGRRTVPRRQVEQWFLRRGIPL
ncbi:MAG TPA: glycosyltransferase family 2 protein [Thermoanaerobaculia bacterium]|nr:glycosyltransferase family 2 protein [Thermoanaerobaculia bacterium]